MTTIENIERVLRQLEALGDNLEHPSTETMIEIEVNQQVNLGRRSISQVDNKPTSIKGGQKQDYKLDKTSALSTLQTNQKEPQISKSRKRPCIFCTRDHWDSECDVYPTVKSRMKRLKSLKKCVICFKDSHKTELCKAKKKCFYCKGLHHSALRDKRSTSPPNIITLPRKQELTQLSADSPTFLYHSAGMTQTDTPQETLLLCKGTKIMNPEYPQRQQRTLALFDIGSQMSFISKKLSSQLKLIESEPRTMLVAPFGTKIPIQCPTADARVNVQTEDKEIITINGHVVEYLTQELQVVDI
ncbi:unnamed protein product, partial [Onchocerca ochengi]|uniref:DUF1758 domain-containing protein n=1 Tax=Onchocerca ochengi TaxID=42157 RepID=A0A182E449_ONCOC